MKWNVLSLIKINLQASLCFMDKQVIHIELNKRIAWSGDANGTQDRFVGWTLELKKFFHVINVCYFCFF